MTPPVHQALYTEVRGVWEKDSPGLYVKVLREFSAIACTPARGPVDLPATFDKVGVTCARCRRTRAWLLGARTKRASEAYALHKGGASWNYVAGRLGLGSRGDAYDAVLWWSEAAQVDPPAPPREEDRAIYKTYRDSDMTWFEVGVVFDAPPDQARTRAKRHAAREGLPWPLHKTRKPSPA